MIALSALTALLASAAPHATTPADPWWQRDVVYEVFVRSFADSDGDGVGDLRGLTAHLDDLKGLGVDDVWLTPIMPSPSYHGYDVVDETGVNPAYGTLADFNAFVSAAHARHMHVILDFVLNHTSDQHPWFTGKDSRAYYVWKPRADDRYRRPWDNASPWHNIDGAAYLGLFSAHMPDLNLENPAVERALVDAMKTWLARGVDGFRLDAVRHLVESERADGTVQMVDTSATHALLARVHTELAQVKPDVLLVGEAWADAQTVATYAPAAPAPAQLQLAFSFDVAKGIVAAVRDGERAPLVEALEGASASASVLSQAPFLTNHDQVRAMRAFNGDVDEAKLAAALLMALPGTPFVYYGEEIGMQGGAPSEDENKRTPMRFTASAPGFGFTTSATPWFRADERAGVDVVDERADASSLWRTYQSLIALRHQNRALTSAHMERVRTDGGGRGALAFVRGDASDPRVLVIANVAHEPSAPFAIDVKARVLVLLAAKGVSAPITLGPDGVHVPSLAPR